MLIEMAMADACAVAYEFLGDRPAPPNDLRYHRHPGRPEHRPGCYTDDTMRAVVNAEIVLSGRGWYDPTVYARGIMTAYLDDQRDVWSRRFQTHLATTAHRSAETFMTTIRRRATNGCVMGVAPLAYLPDAATIRLAASAQTLSTHEGSGCQYAQGVALGAHYLLERIGPRGDLPSYLREEVDWQDDAVRDAALADVMKEPTHPGMPARDIFVNAVSHILRATSRSTMLRDIIAKGGDTDSLAAVAMAMASCDPDIADDLPGHLFENLEADDVRRRLRELDARLAAFRNGED